uniref:Uncharacterized protein n=1 Tax=Anguilla anguilla TaxID=7936 RepID=A0A0E9R0W2_ANGAN
MWPVCVFTRISENEGMCGF